MQRNEDDEDLEHTHFSDDEWIWHIHNMGLERLIQPSTLIISKVILKKKKQLISFQKRKIGKKELDLFPLRYYIRS